MIFLPVTISGKMVYVTELVKSETEVEIRFSETYEFHCYKGCKYPCQRHFYWYCSAIDAKKNYLNTPIKSTSRFNCPPQESVDPINAGTVWLVISYEKKKENQWKPFYRVVQNIHIARKFVKEQGESIKELKLYIVYSGALLFPFENLGTDFRKRTSGHKSETQKQIESMIDVDEPIPEPYAVIYGPK